MISEAISISSLSDQNFRKASSETLVKKLFFPLWRYCYRFISSFFLLTALAMLTQVSTAFALPNKAKLVSVRSDKGSAGRLQTNNLINAQSLNFKIIVPGSGHVEISVIRHKLVDGVAFFQGSSKYRHRGSSKGARLSKIDLNKRSSEGWAAATVSENEVTLNFAASGSNGSTRYFALSGYKEKNFFKVSKVTNYALIGKKCSSGHDLSSHDHVSDRRLTDFEPRTQTLRRSAKGKVALALKVRNVADHLMVRSFGSGAERKMAQIANSAGSIFKRDLGIAIRDKGTVDGASTSRYPDRVTDASQLLNAFRLSGNRTAGNDVAVLFTRRNMNGNVVGIAYTGVMCRSPSYSYGVVQSRSSALDVVVYAHELAHGLNAQHVTSGIMKASVSGGESSFSGESQRQISSYVRAYGSCL